MFALLEMIYKVFLRIMSVNGMKIASFRSGKELVQLMDNQITFSYISGKTVSKINIRPIELLANRPTFRVTKDWTFLGYIERISPFKYKTISSKPIEAKILDIVVQKLEKENFIIGTSLQ